MQSQEARDLFGAIDAHLRGCREGRSLPGRTLRYWDGKTEITPLDFQLLLVLMHGPLCLYDLALRLECDTTRLGGRVERLVALRILHLEGDGYANSNAANAFCSYILKR